MRTAWNKGLEWSPEIRLKLSNSHKGIKQSLTTIEKRRQKMLGHKVSVETRKKIGLANSGESSSAWRGDQVSYSGLHYWVRRHLGYPGKCEHCGETKMKLQWANKSHEYKRDLSDWVRLCIPCHKRYDLNFIKGDK